jgi:hypothetical protein
MSHNRQSASRTQAAALRRAACLMLCLALSGPAGAQTILDGYFVESGGLLVIEAESIGTFPDAWRNASNHTAPNLNLSAGAASGNDFLTWQGSQSFGTPGNSTLIYPIEITTPGTYRFNWRNQVGNGTNTTEHNDTWLRITSDAFYGEQNGGSIVCPKGFNPAQNDCTGSAPEGGGGNGWFKVYSSGANSWRWQARTSDNDAHNIFVRFDSPGLYEIQLSARSSFHIVDRMVLFSDAFTGDPESLNLPQSTFIPGSEGPGDKLTVDASGQWFELEQSGTPVFMAGMGGPEGFLFETDARKQEIVDDLVAQDVNALYFHSLRSFQGDGYSFEDPYVINEDVTSAVDTAVLDNWRGFLDQLDDAGIISWFHILDDTARPWGCSVPLSNDAKRYISTIVNRFKDLDHLVWVAGEEFLMGSCSAAQDRALMRAIAAEIRLHDPVHPIGVHHNNGQSMQFDEPDEPVINVFAQQICGSSADRSPEGIHAAAERGDFVYVMAECHPWHLQLLGAENRRMIRLSNWATAMAGGYVLLYNAYECQERGQLCSRNSAGNNVAANDPHDPTTGMLADLRRLREFMEASRFSELLPDDGRATAATDWVLSNDQEGIWIAYSNDEPATMGISGLGSDAQLRLRWYNPTNGAEVIQQRSASASPFQVPAAMGEDVALFIERLSGDPPPPPPPSSLTLSLVNATTNTVSQPLLDNSVFSSAELGFNSWSAVVSTAPAGTNSVLFTLSGARNHGQTENNAPYALFGDNNGNFAGEPLDLGVYVLRVRAFDGASGNGALLGELNIDFEVSADGSSRMILRDGFEAP